MNDTELLAAIAAEKAALGDRLLILGHHYQDAKVVSVCDAVGDSLELSRLAAGTTAERILFCGVRFMAETADILARDANGQFCGRSVYQPDPEAGCPMADMATSDALETAWSVLTEADPDLWVPIVYVNSSAEVKAFCGRHGGSACTSGNGKHVVSHFLKLGAKILFAPDQHLCSNILRELGYPKEAVALWHRDLPNGGLTPEVIRQAKLIAWDGCCPIHAGYTRGDVMTARAQYPDAKLLIHPEAPSAVAALAEHVGSTKAIIDAVHRAEPGEKLLIGTEDHLVQRLKATHQHLEIHPLRPILCEDMGMTTLAQVLHVLRTWDPETRVRVPDHLVLDARACVERMLAL